MTTRIELDGDGDEWIEINKKVEDAVKERAMENNERYGDALNTYLTNALTDSDE